MTKKLLLLLCGFVGIAFFEAFIFMFMWNKFIPIVTGFSEINYWLAWGISLLIGFVRMNLENKTPNTSNEEEDSVSSILSKLLFIIVLDACVLGLSALISLGI